MQSTLRIASLVFSLSAAVVAAPGKDSGTKTFQLPDGSSATLGPDGLGFRRDAQGNHARPFSILRPSGQSPLGSFGPSDLELQRRIAVPHRPMAGGGSVVVTFANAAVEPETQAATRGRATSEPGTLESTRRWPRSRRIAPPGWRFCHPPPAGSIFRAHTS